MGILSWLGLGGQRIDVCPVEKAMLRPVLPIGHPDALSEMESLLEARILISGTPLNGKMNS
jgi:hypothetical protein